MRFPAKLTCIPVQNGLPIMANLLVISDTGNNRLLIINEETGQCVDVVGNSRIGLVDGAYEEASFHHPQGMCHVYREG